MSLLLDALKKAAEERESEKSSIEEVSDMLSSRSLAADDDDNEAVDQATDYASAHTISAHTIEDDEPVSHSESQLSLEPNVELAYLDEAITDTGPSNQPHLSQPLPTSESLNSLESMTPENQTHESDSTYPEPIHEFDEQNEPIPDLDIALIGDIEAAGEPSGQLEVDLSHLDDHFASADHHEAQPSEAQHDSIDTEEHSRVVTKPNLADFEDELGFDNTGLKSVQNSETHSQQLNNPTAVEPEVPNDQPLKPSNQEAASNKSEKTYKKEYKPGEEFIDEIILSNKKIVKRNRIAIYLLVLITLCASIIIGFGYHLMMNNGNQPIFNAELITSFEDEIDALLANDGSVPEPTIHVTDTPVNESIYEPVSATGLSRDLEANSVDYDTINNNNAVDYTPGIQQAEDDSTPVTRQSNESPIDTDQSTSLIQAQDSTTLTTETTTPSKIREKIEGATPQSIPKPIPKSSQKPISKEITETKRTSKISNKPEKINNPQKTIRRVARPSIMSHLNDGYQALKSGDIQSAKREYERAYQLNSDHRDAILGLAAVDQALKQWQSAFNRYQTLLGINPKDDLARAGLLKLSQNMDTRQLESQLKSIIQESTNPSAYLYLSLGNIYASLKEWSKAYQAYLQAWRKEPNNPNYAYNVAISLEHLQMFKESLHYYQLAIDHSLTEQAQFSKQQLLLRINELQYFLDTQ